MRYRISATARGLGRSTRIGVIFCAKRIRCTPVRSVLFARVSFRECSLRFEPHVEFTGALDSVQSYNCYIFRIYRQCSTSHFRISAKVVSVSSVPCSVESNLRLVSSISTESSPSSSFADLRRVRTSRPVKIAWVTRSILHRKMMNGVCQKCTEFLTLRALTLSRARGSTQVRTRLERRRRCLTDNRVITTTLATERASEG